MSAAALPPEEPGQLKARERRTMRSFFRHIAGGYLVGTAVGLVGYVAMILVVGPEKLDIPWFYTALALYQAGMLGGFVGVGVFMTRERRKGDDDGPGGGLPASTAADVPAPARPRAIRPVRTEDAPAGALPVPG